MKGAAALGRKAGWIGAFIKQGSGDFNDIFFGVGIGDDLFKDIPIIPTVRIGRFFVVADDDITRSVIGVVKIKPLVSK